MSSVFSCLAAGPAGRRCDRL